jgi:hypothetical protein
LFRELLRPRLALSIRLRRCGSRIVLNRRIQRGNSRIQDLEQVRLAISTARLWFRIAGKLSKTSVPVWLICIFRAVSTCWLMASPPL